MTCFQPVLADDHSEKKVCSTVKMPKPTSSAAFPRASVTVLRYREGMVSIESHQAICERKLGIYANNVPLVDLLCSNDSLEELAYGFLYSEQVIHSLEDVNSFTIDKQTMTARFELSVEVKKPACPTVSSGFGGKVLGLNVTRPACSLVPTNPDKCTAESEHGRIISFLEECPHIIDEALSNIKAMDACAREYRATRGTHCSALFKNGTLVASYEDIGRHNTFDKLVGYCLLKGISVEQTLLATTGRVSGEMCAKAIRLGVSGVISLSGPTDIAISLAQDAGLFLAGYVRDTSAIIYSCNI